jgi:preprotein translocase subunit YajC
VTDNLGAVAHLLPLAQAAPGGDASSIMGMLPMFAVMIGVMYFLMIRPQQQKEKKKTEMLAQLAKGDSVVTVGGICGTVVGISDNHVVVKVDDNCKIEFLKSSIAHRVEPDKESKK